MEDDDRAESFLRRQRSKRTFGAMSASHGDDSHDDHYNNDHSSRHRRRRLNTPPPASPPRLRTRVHYPGDGFDFRRPVMSAAAANNDNNNNTGSTSTNGGRTNRGGGGSMGQTPVIDLTDEDGTEESQGSETYSNTVSNAATAGSSRVQRLPRFGRDLIEIESSGGEEEPGEENEEGPDPYGLPGARYLALPRITRRPPVLRAPSRAPLDPPPDRYVNMDDVEVLETRQRTQSRQHTPNTAQQNRGPRSVTPYPGPAANPYASAIDLTGDDDNDDVVLVDARQREDANNGPRYQGHGARMYGEGGYQHMGNIANLLRGGGRLVQRLQGLAGMEQDLRALTDEVRDQNRHRDRQRRHHGPQAHAGGHHHHNHHRHHEHRGRGHQGMHGPAGPALFAPALDVMMDYNMTGFDMGMGGGHRPPSPKYSPPPEPEEGFTRSPGEDDVVVCPNCGDELAVGESDVKQEIWVVKACGHAYCGECAQQRGRSTHSAKKGGKGKAPITNNSSSSNYGEAPLSPPFKKCVVEGCGKPAAKNSMVHVFLGS